MRLGSSSHREASQMSFWKAGAMDIASGFALNGIGIVIIISQQKNNRWIFPVEEKACVYLKKP